MYEVPRQLGDFEIVREIARDAPGHGVGPENWKKCEERIYAWFDKYLGKVR
jgi:hypothetical protein